MVSASSSAWVGCSCAPSPALITAALTTFAIWCGAPDDEWRMTIASGAIACKFSAVSINVSPLTTLEVEAEMLMASADRRFAAISKLVRVRVEASKKRLMMVFPRNVGTFLIWRWFTSRKVSAVSRMRLISSGVRSAIPRRSLRFNGMHSFLFNEQHLLRPVELREHHFDNLFLGGRYVFADVIGLDRQFAPAAVNEHGQLHAARAPEINQLIHRGADRAARVEHVVNQNDRLAGDVCGQLGLVDDGPFADGAQVVAVERDVQRAGRDVNAVHLFDPRRQPFGQRDAPPSDSDQQHVR